MASVDRFLDRLAGFLASLWYRLDARHRRITLRNLEFAYGQYQTYQVPVAKIESITGLNFGDLRNQDPLAVIESLASAFEITRPEDLKL